MNKSTDIKQQSIDHPKMNELRSKIFDYIKENPNDFHYLDIELLKTSNYWINRFLNFNNQTFDNAYEHLINTFKYRNENGIRSIDKATMPLELWMLGTAFIYKGDKDGRPTLYFRAENHFRPGGKFNDIFKQFIIVMIDEIDRLANRESGFNIFLDLCNIGWKNLDLDIVHFIISTTRDYYPNGCKYFFIYGIPWAFNYVVKGVLAAVPSDSAKKVKMISGSHYDNLSINELTSNFTKSVDINNNIDKLNNEKNKKSSKLPIEEFYDLENVPSFLGGKATLNYRIAPKNSISIQKLSKSILNYSDEEMKQHLKNNQNIIDEANNYYKIFKESNFEFEFDLDNMTERLTNYFKF